MRKKYKQNKIKEENKIEYKKIDLPKTIQQNSTNNLEDKKDNFTKLSKMHLIESNQRNTISYNAKEPGRFRKFYPFKRDENKKNENISKINNTINHTENKKDINKNFRFEKKKKIELNGIDYIKFNKLKNNLYNKFNEKMANTEPNNTEPNNEGNEKVKENNSNIRERYSRRKFNLSININSEQKEKQDNKINKDKIKRYNILENLEKETLKENKTQRKSINIPNENIKKNTITENCKTTNNETILSNNKNESSKILSLIKKCKKRSIYSLINNNNNKFKKLNTENYDNINNTNEKGKITYYKTEKKDNYTDIKSTSTTNSRNRIKNTFNFLIHQAHENSNLSDTFSKMYESYITFNKKKRNKNQLKTAEKNKSLIIEENDKIEKAQKGLSTNENHSLSSISYLIKEYGTEKLKKPELKIKDLNIPHIKDTIDKKMLKKGNLQALLDISPKTQYNNIENNDYSSNNDNQESISVTNKIINNNTFNTTYNIYKINNTISKKDMPSKVKEKIFKITDINHQTISNSSTKRTEYYKIFINKKDFKKNENNKKIKLNAHQRTDSFMNKPYKKYKEIILNNEKIMTNNINIEIIYSLADKCRIILNKINNYEICYNECHDWIIYYFNNNLYDIFLSLFKNKRNKNNVINKIKIEVLCYFLCYDASFSKTFSQAGILLKTIFHLLQNNFLLLLDFIINNYTNSNNNDEFNNYLINDLNKIIENELKINLSLQEIHNENCIIEIFEQNFKQINNYYKMIIDNLYNYSFNTTSPENRIDDINNNKIYKFPHCISLDIEKLNNNQKLKIISLFFFDAYKLLNNYNILDLKLFYDLFLYKNNNKIKNNDNNKMQKYINFNNNKYKNESYNLLSNNFKLNNNSKNLLNPIKSYYKYSLLINLDILVYYNEIGNIYNNINIDKNKKIILRPGLIQFLQEMKQIYELILFTNNSFNYISQVLKTLENNEKFFEYSLSNNQINFEKDGSIKNLDSLGRDINNIIILDKEQSLLKLNKENIIFVKPFYGDINNDKNILKDLIEILKQIKYDMEENEDIRIPLNNHRLEIFTKITSYLF